MTTYVSLVMTQTTICTYRSPANFAENGWGVPIIRLGSIESSLGCKLIKEGSTVGYLAPFGLFRFSFKKKKKKI